MRVGPYVRSPYETHNAVHPHKGRGTRGVDLHLTCQETVGRNVGSDLADDNFIFPYPTQAVQGFATPLVCKKSNPTQRGRSSTLLTYFFVENTVYDNPNRSTPSTRDG